MNDLGLLSVQELNTEQLLKTEGGSIIVSFLIGLAIGAVIGYHMCD